MDLFPAEGYLTRSYQACPDQKRFPQRQPEKALWQGLPGRDGRNVPDQHGARPSLQKLRVSSRGLSLIHISPWTVFRKITLPQLMPIIIYISVIMLIRGFNVYTQAYILASDSSGSPGFIVRVIVYDICLLYTSRFEEDL